MSKDSKTIGVTIRFWNMEPGEAQPSPATPGLLNRNCPGGLEVPAVPGRPPLLIQSCAPGVASPPGNYVAAGPIPEGEVP